MQSCFFMGHRDSPQDLLPPILHAVEQCIRDLGVSEFVVGHYGSFDRMAAAAVTQARQNYPHIKLLLLLPYHPSERPVAPPAGFDGTLYPPGMEHVPRRFVIPRANRYMIGHADCLITYVWHPSSNARTLLEYARRRERLGTLHIFNLAPPID